MKNEEDKEVKNIMEKLEEESRLLMETQLEPVQGNRFQPTGFPDLGAAEFTAPEDGTPMLLVESAQSMANRMEAVCWDEDEEELVEPLRGLPYIHVDLDDEGAYTNSILEAHRINSEYITGSMGDEDFTKKIADEIGYDEKKPVPFKDFYRTLLKYDTNSLIHGVFLEEIGGRLRVPRMLTGFIEASGVKQAQSGGVKKSRVEPGKKEGEGHVPFARTEYVADEITAYFNLDLAGMRSFGLDSDAEELLLQLSLYKVQGFLRDGLRLRTACDLEPVNGLQVKRPDGFQVPSLENLENTLPELIQSCEEKDLFADPPKTELEASG